MKMIFDKNNIQLNNNQLFILKKNPSIFLFLILILFVYNISIISCDNNYIYFPLKRRDNTYLKNLKNITDIMKFIYLEPLITELNIGNPEQKVNIIFRTDCTYIYLTSNKHNTTKKDQASNFMQLKYGDFKYFNEDNSTSIKYYEKNFDFHRYAYNNQFFSKCISENVKINNHNIELDLMLSNSIELEESGAICLQLENTSSVLQFTPSLPVLLKKNYSLIDNYRWFVYYGQNNEKDYLVMGTTVDKFKDPETGKKVYPSLDFENDFFNVNDELDVHKAAMTINFDQIYLLSETNKEKEEFEDEKNLKGKLIYNIGFIVGTINYSQYIEKNLLGIYLELNKCYKGIFSQRPNLVGEEYTYYYCDDSLYNNIKASFKKIIFKQVSLSKKFELTFDDLFLRLNGYLIFLVIFSTHQHKNWDFGTPFLKKYQFDFDFQNKKVGYYHVERINTNLEMFPTQNNFLKYTLLILLILILSIVLVILGIYIGKNSFSKRKKRANELDDDDYEYEKKEGNNLIIN